MLACTTVPGEGSNGPRGESMGTDQLLQSDFNRTMTLAMRDNLDSIYRLQEKLYKRNPGYWRGAGHTSLEAALEHGKTGIRTATPPVGLDGLQDIEVLAVAFEPAYDGDRVAAFIYGLSDMILTAHRDKSRFYLTDNLDAQHVFNAARNVEAAAWLLNSRRDSAGQPLLWANEISDDVINLSFEREFGQLVGRLDLVASLLDEKIRRVGINYLQGLFFFNFLPVR
ncbi:MAG TPA: hypothetical protein VK104_09485 [Burkholderiaceae bacterium]|nr:hypothetical protein [Burkholderiaceae bacterium]